MNKKNIKKRSYHVFLGFFLCFLLLSQVIFGAEGDLLWDQTTVFVLPNNIAFGIAADSTGMYVAGIQDNNWQVEKRSLADGTLIWDQTFNSGTMDAAVGIAVDSSGVYVSGFQNNRAFWRVEKRSLVDGSLIWAKTEDLSIGGDEASYLSLDSTGVYIVGSQNSRASWRVEKRSLVDGSLIWEKVEDLTVGQEDNAVGVAVDSTGVYIVGSQNSTDFWRVEKRSLVDGSLIWEKVEDLTAGGAQDYAEGIAIDSTGVYVVGTQDNRTSWRAEKRSLIDGSLIWEKVDNSGGVNSIARGVSASSTGLYVSGIQGNDWRVEKRSLIDGSLDWEEVDDFGGIDRAYQNTYFDDGLYIVGSTSGYTEWRLEGRKKTPEPSAYIDIGLRVYNGTEIVKIAGEPLGTLTSPLRIEKNGNIYGIVLVDLGDPNESGVRIQTSSGIKGLRKYP